MDVRLGLITKNKIKSIKKLVKILNEEWENTQEEMKCFLGIYFYKNNIKSLVNLAEIVFDAMKFIDKLRKNDIIIYNFVCIREILWKRLICEK